MEGDDSSARSGLTNERVILLVQILGEHDDPERADAENAEEEVAAVVDRGADEVLEVGRSRRHDWRRSRV